MAPKIVKVSRIAGCQGCIPSQRDTGNHRVPKIYRASFLLPECHQVAGLLRGCGIGWFSPIERFISPASFESWDELGRLRLVVERRVATIRREFLNSKASGCPKNADP